MLWGDRNYSIPCCTSDFDYLKKWMNRKWTLGGMDASERLDDLPVHTMHAQCTPYHHPQKMDVLSKTFFKIFLAAKWLVRHSNTYVSQTAAMITAFSSVFILLLCLGTTHKVNNYIEDKATQIVLQNMHIFKTSKVCEN